VNLAHVLDGHPDDAVAVLTGDTTTTYGELRRAVAGLRGGLVREGVAPGDRVAIVAPNDRSFVDAYLAVLGVGAVAVPLNPTSPEPERAREVAAVGARLVLDPTGVDALRNGEPVDVVERAPSDVAVLIFTAGTAGSPKAAMLTHGNLRANIDQVRQLPARRLHADDVSLGVLPLFHIFGLNVVLGQTLAAGASVVLVDRFHADATLEVVRHHGCTVVAGAPPMWAAWLALADAGPDDLATVRLAVSGASKLSEEVAAAFEARFGIRISEGYGLTEASPIVASAAGSDAPHGSIGSPVPGVQVRLVEADGDDALLGDSGEIWVRGPNVFPGYWDDPAATAAALTEDGWLRTGDIAAADEDGHLYIVDRSKDLIIVSGFNVYPAEVEDVLLEHPGIEAAAVIGVESLKTGETVRAFVVAAAGATLDEAEIIAFVGARLARYKCPTSIEIVAEIPQGMGGKVLRRQLRSA
jgi:long-chain acyl-CoA synthetase